MSGETEWTVGTLHVHVVSLVEGLRRENDDRDRLLVQIMDERRDSMTTAFMQYRQDQRTMLDKATTATDQRFASVNEFRAQLSDQAATFLTRTEYDVAHGALESRLTELVARVDTQSGERQGFRMTGGLVAAAITAIASIAVVVNIVVILVTH